MENSLKKPVPRTTSPAHNSKIGFDLIPLQTNIRLWQENASSESQKEKYIKPRSWLRSSCDFSNAFVRELFDF